MTKNKGKIKHQKKLENRYLKLQTVRKLAEKQKFEPNWNHKLSSMCRE